MHDITQESTELVGGAGIMGWIGGQLFTMGVKFAADAVMSGQVDYAGLVETSGSGYNMLGA